MNEGIMRTLFARWKGLVERFGKWYRSRPGKYDDFINWQVFEGSYKSLERLLEEQERKIEALDPLVSTVCSRLAETERQRDEARACVRQTANLCRSYLHHFNGCIFCNAPLNARLGWVDHLPGCPVSLEASWEVREEEVLPCQN